MLNLLFSLSSFCFIIMLIAAIRAWRDSHEKKIQLSKYTVDDLLNEINHKPLF